MRPSTFQVYAMATLTWAIVAAIVALTGFSPWYVTLGASICLTLVSGVVAYEEYHGELMTDSTEVSA